jgi:hypothetical protein
MRMSSRTAEFTSAILIGVLVGVFAGAYLIVMPYGTADDCLSQPRGEAAAGERWFYRVDRSTKRHCWYLKGRGEQVARAASPERSASAKAPSQKPEAAAQLSIADARAELRSRARIEDDTSAVAARPARAPAAAGPDDGNIGSNVMSRWPEPIGVNSSVAAQPESPPLVVADNTQPDQATTTPARSTMTGSPLTGSPLTGSGMIVGTPPMTAAPGDMAAPPSTANSSAGKYSGSLQELLVVAFAALALAGLTGSAVYRLARLSYAKRRYDASRRSADWQPPKRKARKSKARPAEPLPASIRVEESMVAPSWNPGRDFAPQPRPRPELAPHPNVAVLSEYAPKPRANVRAPEAEENFDSIEELLMQLAK